MNLDSDERVHIRRVTLAKFTGLESFASEMENRKHSMSLGKLEHSTKKDRSSSLIDTYSNRRRPTIKSAVADIKCTELQRVPENELAENPGQINFHDVDEKIEKLRKRIEKAMNDLPNQSPKKSFDCENEKIELLKESRKLASVCKTMLTEIHDNVNGKYFSQIVREVLEAAEKVTCISERMIQKSNYIFQAQLMATKTEQMLKSLLDVLQSIKEVQTKDSNSIRLLTARSTTLTANIRQLLSTTSSG